MNALDRAFGYVVSALVLTGGVAPSPSRAQGQPLLAQSASEAATQTADPDAIVSALKAVAGNPRRARASFAKGQCMRGTYMPSDRAAEITKSLSFTHPSRVLARFSVGGGNPGVADTTKTVLRGLSFKLEGDGISSDILVENAPVHFAKTLDQMLAFLKVRIPGPDGKQDQGKIQAFSAANPETLNQTRFIAAKPLPGSFAGTTYWGVHSFPATNAKGETRFVKFKVTPDAGEITLTEEEGNARPANFLVQDVEKRIADGSGIRFHVLALLDRPGDPTMDVTIRWPDEDRREAVELGTVAITEIANNEPCDESIFDPANLADGIGHPPDEIFAARQAAYAISLSKRQE